MKAGFTALVVDDDAFARRTAVLMLRRLGASSILEASDGREALSLAAAGDNLDLIICDLRMPQVDGIETLQGLALQNFDALVILTSGADARVLRSAGDVAAELGMRTVRTIGKPLTLQKLKDIFTETEAQPAEVAQPQQAGGRRIDITIADIRRGLAQGEFVAYFQPKVEMNTRRVVGAEALIRWLHPVYGVLAPAHFLSIAHDADLFDDVTNLMLSHAFRSCASWRRAGLEISVSVNLPVACLTTSDLPQRLSSIAAGEGLEPEQIIFEVTEDGWLQHQAVARSLLTRLRLLGFGLSIDDFGTCYSTLQQLLQAPFNEMKIDQSFVRLAPDDPESAAALLSSISLAHRLGLTVVAEGVETETHWAMLAEAGCDLAQGYLIARPMPAEAFIEWSDAWESEAAPAGFAWAPGGRPFVERLQTSDAGH
jgi:EAL domain-containing protein (putative c-di-GMP-specific phosphodiesterase class I)/ActR/RegA family two-component response regulator